MKLQEVFNQARADGFTMAGDMYSYHGRKIGNWSKEIAADRDNYQYSRSEYSRRATAVQNSTSPSNEYRFW